MKQVLVCITISAVLVSAGCSTGPRRGAPAPVVRSEAVPAAAATGAAQSAAAAESGVYPLQEPLEVEITPYVTGDSITPGVSPYPAAEPAAPVNSNNSAVVALLSNAGRQQQGGDIPGAAATLERALRIEPRNARLWHRLAALRLDQQQYRMAADLADKSNSLAPDDRELTRANWRLIARARSALGDSEGARQAWQKAQ